MRFFITFSYNGTNYCGWQRQPNGVAVQQELEKALTTILRTPIELTGAGRTDAGVHALNMVAHFDVNPECMATSILSPCFRGMSEAEGVIKKLINNLNSLLPYDIAVKNIERVNDEAHARFDALSRKYEYHIITSKNPFLKEQACRIHFPLNIELMNEAAKILFEYEDFTSFSKLHTDVKTNNCTIMEAYWQQRGEELVFTIKANRFLRNMVRAIVGTLMEVGRERLTIEGFRQVIEAKNRCSAGHSVPACGLYFIEAEYLEKTYSNKI